MKAIRVLLADDHPALRMGLRLLLDRAADIDVIEETSEGLQTLARIESLKPDVAVLDVQMPGMDGAQIARALREKELATRVLALSAYDDEVYVRAMLAADVAGYVLKDEAPSEIVAAVRAAAAGKRFFSAGVRPIVDRFSRGELPAGLTEREYEVLLLLTKGHSNLEIAHALGVKERTAVFHVSNILQKLDVSSRVEAVVWARDQGLATA